MSSCESEDSGRSSGKGEGGSDGAFVEGPSPPQPRAERWLSTGGGEWGEQMGLGPE